MNLENIGLITEEELELYSGNQEARNTMEEVASATSGAAAGGAAGSLGGAAAGYVNR